MAGMFTPAEAEQAHYAASTESCNPHESGKELGTLQHSHGTRTNQKGVKSKHVGWVGQAR